MSQTTPRTDSAVFLSPALGALVAQADTSPVVADDLNAAFGQFSHASAAQFITCVLMWFAARYGMALDATTAAMIAAPLAMAAGYAWSIVSRRMARAKVTASPA